MEVHTMEKSVNDLLYINNFDGERVQYTAVVTTGSQDNENEVEGVR